MLNSEHRGWGWVAYYKLNEDGAPVECPRERKEEATLVRFGTAGHRMQFRLPGQGVLMREVFALVEKAYQAGERAARAKVRAALLD